MRGTWLPEEEAFLRECANANISAELIGRMLERTPATVRMKRYKLGLFPPGGKMLHLMTEVGGTTVAEIKRVVADHFEIPVEEMESECRKRKIARPRQVAMFFAREVSRKSYPRIGSMFGGRDHTTAIHAVTQVRRLMEQDHNFKDEVTTLQDSLLFQKDKHPVGDKCHSCTFLDSAASA